MNAYKKGDQLTLGKSTVFANKQGVSSANSGATASNTLPDVCLTQIGNAVVPIPYSNTAQSSDLKDGSKTVHVDKASAAIDGCSYSKSTGDEAGNKKGIISGTKGDKAEFGNYSFDVKIEGKGVCRNTDLTMHNNRNTIGMNSDSSADPPPPKNPPPPKTTFRFKVLEHISWENYDPDAKCFKPGDANNNPIQNRKFKIRFSDGSIREETTDDEGIIELKDQDVHSKFEVIFEPEDARLNNKYYLFHHAITPLAKILE